MGKTEVSLPINYAVKEMMKQSGKSQQKLAEDLGYSNQSAVSNRLRRQKLDFNALHDMAKAMGYDIIFTNGENSIKIV